MPPNGEPGIDALVAVDPDHPRADLPGQQVGARRGRGSTARRPGRTRRRWRCAIASSSLRNVVTVTNGPKTSSRQTAAGRVGSDDGRPQVVAVGQRRVVRGGAAGQDLAALLAGDLDVAEDPVAVAGRRQRAHLGRRVERVAEADRLGERDEPCDEVVGDRLVEDQPRAGDARLALVVEDRERRAVDRGLDVRRRRRRCWRPCRRARAGRASRSPADSSTIRRPVAVEPGERDLADVAGARRGARRRRGPGPGRC